MIQDKCNHSWKKRTDASQQLGVGVIPTIFSCETCKTFMTAPEVFQLEALENQNETLKHLKGFQKYIAIIAIVISFLALIISMYK